MPRPAEDPAWIDKQLVGLREAKHDVTSEKGEKRSAGEWVPDSGRALRLTQARVTQDEAPVPAMVCVKKKGMKESWSLACSLLTLLGAAGESLGMERYLKANTVKTRTYSLFRQGCEYYQAIPMMPEDRLLPLMARFAELLGEQAVFREVFGPR